MKRMKSRHSLSTKQAKLTDLPGEQPYIYFFEFNLRPSQQQTRVIKIPAPFVVRGVRAVGKEALFVRPFSSDLHIELFSNGVELPVPMFYRLGDELVVSVKNLKPGRRWNKIMLSLQGSICG